MLTRASDSPWEGTEVPEEAALYLERVRQLAPDIAAAGDRIESERRVPESLLEKMLAAGLFRMLLPRSAGGAEVHPLTFMRVVEEIARTEAAPAWNVGQNAVCAMVAAYLSPEAAEDIFGDARSIVAWGPPGPEAKAVVTEGGYRVTGNWAFASGGRHATWLGGYCPVIEPDGTPRCDAAGKPVRRLMLFPAAEATMTDIWHVIGLRGTASDAFAVTELFVPEEYTTSRDNLDEVRERGWLYQFKTTNLYACGFGSVALGVARSMLDAFIALAGEKTPRGYTSALRENAATQQDLGLAEARLRAARAFLFQSMEHICAAAQRSGRVTIDQRVTIRLAATHATREAVRVARFAYDAAGATAVFNGSPFERRFRDIHAISQQVQGRKSHYQTVGKALLGFDAETLFL